MAIRIMIVDDHQILRAGLKTLLTSDANLEVVAEAMSADAAIPIAGELQPDILLMDIGMPGSDALAATKTLSSSYPQIKILILTMHEDSALVQEFIRSGASGYIIKRAAESELIDAIYAVWRGMIYIHPSLMPSLVTPKNQPAQSHPSVDEPLTAREIEVLKMIVKGYTNRQIAASMSISIRTVETHRSNIMAKLNLHSRVDLVRYAAKHGYMSTDDTTPK